MVGDSVPAMRNNEERGGVVVNGDEGEGSSISVRKLPGDSKSRADKRD